MNSVKNLRKVLMVGAASLALVACSDTDIASPGTTPAPTTPTPTTPTPTPTTPSADISLAPSSVDVSHDNVSVVSVTTAEGTTLDLVEISGTITTDLDLADVIGSNDVDEVGFYIDSTVFVGNDAGADGSAATGVVLTIPAGAQIFGSGETASLVVSRGSQIDAVGTESAPIVFTSVAELERQNGVSTAGTTTQRGEWGGLIINGMAPLNVCDTSGDLVADGSCEAQGEAGSGQFGGDVADDNSGTLQYIRIEHGGIVLNEANEANGIAFQGVGSGTTVDHIHVHNNLDDGVEFFGGTVSANYIVVSGQSDDAIDWTDGWTGSVQYALVTPGTDLRDDAYGIEGDNQRPNDLLPRSLPSLSNITIIGNDEWVAGARFRRGTAVNFVNSIVTGAPFGLDIDDSTTYDLFTSDDSEMASLLFDNTGAELRDDGDIPTGFALTNFDNVELTANTLQDNYFPGTAENNIPAADVTGMGTLEAVTYIGAFGPTETVASNWAADWTKPGTVFEEVSADCPTGTTASTDTVDGKDVCDLPAVMTSDIRLANGDDLIYRMTEATFVGTDGGPDAANTSGSVQATLTIEPGVTVFAEAGSEAYLVVTRGSQIRSNGTAAEPVRFTTEEVLTDSIRDGDVLANTRGYWGGLIINGKAPINVCDTSGDAVADGGCEAEGEFASGTFGGNVTADDSGNIFYTRVEYAGVIVNSANEANGIALQGVGSGTDIDYVQIHNNLDDGVEFFGGTVDAKHIVVTGQSDDAIDWTDGWTGRVQYAIVEPGASLRDDAYGIEGDNQRPNDLLPRSAPALSNVTIIGNGEWVAGARFRRGSAVTFVNSIVTGAPFGLDIDDAATYAQFDADESEMASLLFDNTGDELRDDGDIPATFIADHFDADNNISTTAANTLEGFSFFGNATGVVPGTAEAGVTAFDINATDSWFDDVDYIGAVEDADDTWFLGWTIDADADVTSAD